MSFGKCDVRKLVLARSCIQQLMKKAKGQWKDMYAFPICMELPVIPYTMNIYGSTEVKLSYIMQPAKHFNAFSSRLDN